MCEPAGYDTSRSKQAPFPFIREITVDAIASLGDKLWKELVGTEASRKSPMKVSSVQLSFAGIASMENGQRRIEGFFQKPSSTSEQVAATTEQFNPPDSVDSSLKRKRSESPNVSRTDGGVVMQEGNSENPTVLAVGTATPGFLCDRCGERIEMQDWAADSVYQRTSSAVVGDDDDVEEGIERLRREHDDFHFAQDLANEGIEHGSSARRSVIRPSDGSMQSSKKRKPDSSSKPQSAKSRQTSKGDIAKFFAQR